MTLLEVAIASTISMVVSVGAISAMVLVQRNTVQAFWLNQATREARTLSDLVARDLRGALAIEASFEEFSSDGNTLILRVPSIDENGDFVDLENDYDRIIYFASGTNGSDLVREVRPGRTSDRLATNELMGSIIEGSNTIGTFAETPNALGAFVIHYQFTASQTIGERTFEIPISGSVRLRNKV